MPRSHYGGAVGSVRRCGAAVMVLLAVACSGGDVAATPSPTETATLQRFPDVLDAELTQDADATWTVAVTLSSSYDTPERYADAWRVMTPDGVELGIRVLTHHHAAEQPFTRSQSGIHIPAEVVEVVVQGRDQRYGWGGEELTVAVPR